MNKLKNNYNKASALFKGAVFLTVPAQCEAANFIKNKYGLNHKLIGDILQLTEHQIKDRLNYQLRNYVLKGLIPHQEMDAFRDCDSKNVKNQIYDSEASKKDRKIVNKESNQLVSQQEFENDFYKRVTSHMPTERSLKHLDIERLKCFGSLANNEINLDKPLNTSKIVLAIQSDAHFFFTNSEFNHNIALKANDKYFTRAFQVSAMKEASSFHIANLGDNFHGTANYPNQKWDVDRCAIDQAEAYAEISVRNIERALVYFDTVEYTGMGGNHGKVLQNSPSPAHENWDNACLKMIKFAFRKNKRVTFNLTDKWFQIVDILGSKILMTHGDFISGAGSFDSIASNFRKLIDVTPHWDYAIIGHFHRIASLPLPKSRESGKDRHVFINGTYSQGDEFIQKFGSSHSNQQWLFTFDIHGMESEQKVSLYGN